MTFHSLNGTSLCANLGKELVIIHGGILDVSDGPTGDILLATGDLIKVFS